MLHRFQISRWNRAKYQTRHPSWSSCCQLHSSLYLITSGALYKNRKEKNEGWKKQSKLVYRWATTTSITGFLVMLQHKSFFSTDFAPAHIPPLNPTVNNRFGWIVQPTIQILWKETKKEWVVLTPNNCKMNAISVEKDHLFGCNCSQEYSSPTIWNFRTRKLSCQTPT